MRSVRVVTDLGECQDIWERVIPNEQISDLWEVRECFQRHYGHKPRFMVCEDGDGICGFLPVSQNEDTGSYLYYPGETWSGKSWLEQNRLIANDGGVLIRLLSLIPGPFHLRYLQPNEWTAVSGQTVDEIGYYFLPPEYGYDIDRYLSEFSGKSAKRLRREIESFKSRGVEYGYNEEPDFETMISMNLQRFGSSSYFHDPRFLESFRSLLRLFSTRGWLRLTAVKIDGQFAAVDMGAVYNGTYTLLAGGTNPDFPGIAKLINLHHMRWACQQRIKRVDFLCGDFNWKTQFHLTPRPLYLLQGRGRSAAEIETSLVRPSQLIDTGPTAEGLSHV